MNTRSFTKRSFSVLATIILLLVALPVTTVFAATAGPNNAGTGSNVAGTGTAVWSTPEYISADDTSYATADLSGSNIVNSQYLQGTNYGFAIPAAATIDGIQVIVGRHASATGPGVDVRDTVVKLIKNGNMTGDNKADTGTDWQTDPLSSVTYGSATDLWGVSWTPADINATNFGVALAANSDVNRVAYVDYMQITVTYTVHTSTAVNCGAGNPLVQYGSSISCVATVTRAAGTNTPSGSVDWDTNDNGSFGASTCVQNEALGTLTCTTVYTPGAVGDGSHNITATYSGDVNFKGSSGNRDVTVSTIALVPSITANNKVYDGTTTATIATRSVIGALESDEVFLAGGAATFDEKNVGNGKTVTGNAFTLTGAQAGNYHLSPTTATTTANITSAGLTVSGITANSKVYDGTTNATLSGTAVLSGVIIGEDDVTLSGTPIASFANKNVGTGKPVTVIGYTLSGQDIGNYTLSQPAGLTADISAKALTVTAEDKEKEIGDPDPAFTFVTGGFISPDTFVTLPTCSVPEDHNIPDTYDIVCSGGDAGANYEISYVNGTLTVHDIVPIGGKIAPSNSATGQSLSPTLSWESSAGATSYEYCYSSAPGPCSAWYSAGTNTSVPLNGLVAGYTYYWQVRVVNAGGTTEVDDGTWWSFTTQATPACSWPVYTAPTSPSFADVPMNVGHWSWVERLYNSGITAGCSDGNYCPFNQVVRAQMAIFLLRAKHCGSGYTPPAVGDSTGFNDVPLSATYAPWVKQLAAEGITAGCGGGNFCPLQAVNRAQMAIFLLRAKHGATYSPPGVGGSTGFNDVPLSATYAPWVKQLAAEGITAGCGGGNFCPLQNVNRAQMATFLVRAFGLP